MHEFPNFVIARSAATKQSRALPIGIGLTALDCFAALAMMGFGGDDNKNIRGWKRRFSGTWMRVEEST